MVCTHTSRLGGGTFWSMRCKFLTPNIRSAFRNLSGSSATKWCFRRQCGGHLRRWCLHAAHDGEGEGEGADVPLLSDDGAACGGEDAGALLLVGTRVGGEDGSEEYDGEADPDEVAPPDDEDHVGASCAAGGVGMLLRDSQQAHAGCCPPKRPNPQATTRRWPPATAAAAVPAPNALRAADRSDGSRSLPDFSCAFVSGLNFIYGLNYPSVVFTTISVDLVRLQF